MNTPWVVRISFVAMKAKYQVPRGEAANLSEVIAVLFQGIPEDSQSVPEEENSYYYTRNNYRIVFEVLGEDMIRVAYFEPVE